MKILAIVFLGIIVLIPIHNWLDNWFERQRKKKKR